MGKKLLKQKEPRKKIPTSLKVKFANLFLALAILCLIFSAFIGVSTIAIIIYCIFLFAFLIVTLFVTWNLVKEGFDKIEDFNSFIFESYKYLPFVLLGGFLSLVVAFILFAVDKNYARRKGKMITCIVFAVLYVIVIVYAAISLPELIGQ